MSDDSLFDDAPVSDAPNDTALDAAARSDASPAQRASVPQPSALDLLPHGPLLEKLLAGEFVCAVSDDAAFKRLQDETLREALDAYLRPLNRRLATNEDKSVYFLGWRQLDDAAREQLSRQLNDTLHSLLPLLEWLQLVQEALGRDSVPAPGDVLKPGELQAKSEDNPSLRERIERVAGDSFFGSQSDQLDAQVKQVFKRLKEHGYLLQPHGDRQVYLVTGKVEYLLDLVRFIRDEEHLPVADDADGAQEALL